MAPSGIALFPTRKRVLLQFRRARITRRANATRNRLIGRVFSRAMSDRGDITTAGKHARGPAQSAKLHGCACTQRSAAAEPALPRHCAVRNIGRKGDAGAVHVKLTRPRSIVHARCPIADRHTRVARSAQTARPAEPPSVVNERPADDFADPPDLALHQIGA
jgi:hypothetical protein